MAIILEGRVWKSLIYQREINGEEITLTELFIDDQYAEIRKKEIENGNYDVPFSVNEEMMVLDCFDNYLKSIAFKEYSYRTYEEYVSLIKNYIANYFNGYRLKDITEAFVLQLNNKIMSQVAVGNNHCNLDHELIGVQTRNRIRRLLKKIFEAVTEQNLYIINPMQYLKYDYKTDRFKTEWDMKTLNTFFDLSKGKRLNILLHLLFGTELLIKEIIALSWDDLHIGDKEIAQGTCWVNVDKNMRRKTLNELSKMKDQVIRIFPPVMSASGNTRITIYKNAATKKIKIPTKIALLLKEWKSMQEKQNKLVGDYYEDNNLVICLDNGKACEDRVLTKDFEYLKKNKNLPDVKLAKLKSFSKQNIIDGVDVLTRRELYYTFVTVKEIISMEKGYITKTHNNHNNSSFNGDYNWFDLRNIEIPKQKNIDIMKVVSILKNNPEFATELTSILQE